MKKRVLIALIALLPVFILGCTNNNNRYELVLSSRSDYTDWMLVDKKKGTVWIFTSEGWENLGTPPKEAPKKRKRKPERGRIKFQ